MIYIRKGEPSNSEGFDTTPVKTLVLGFGIEKPSGCLDL